MKTEYYCITLKVPTGEIDLVEGLLYLEGVEGIEESLETTPSLLKAYFKKNSQPIEKFIETLRKKLPLGITLTGEIIKSDAISFQGKPFDPLELIPNVWILPPPDMLDCQNAIKRPIGAWLQLVIRPGMAFGTGRHESTQLCAQAIQGLENPGDKTFLDVGTGSGILALFAAKRGFKKVDAVEIDPDARINTLENFELNSVKSIQLFDDIATVKNKYDVVCANIDPPTLTLLHNALIHHLNPNGILILSGITEEQKQIIESRFNHLKLEKTDRLNEWRLFQFRLV